MERLRTWSLVFTLDGVEIDKSAQICWEKFLTFTETQLYFRKQCQVNSHPNMETSHTIYSPFVFMVVGSQIKTPNLELDGGDCT